MNIVRHTSLYLLILCFPSSSFASSGLIDVHEATYGLSCDPAATGNVSDFVSSSCNGKVSCDYAIDHGTIGDPSPGCEKDFYVFYECNGRFLRTKVGKEASGKSAYLSCDLWTGLQGVELERIVKIQQASSGRYLDSKYPNNSVDDYRVVTSRFSAQSFATQMWSASGPKQVGDCTNAFVFTQVASSRLLDAHININNYGVVTRQSQLSSGRDSEQFASQHWQIQAAGKGLYTIRQCAKGEGEGYLDAFESNENDFRAVTRPDQKNDSQRWLITIMGG